MAVSCGLAMAMVTAALLAYGEARVESDPVEIPLTEVGYAYTGAGNDYLVLNASARHCTGKVDRSSTFTCQLGITNTAVTVTHEIVGFGAKAPFSIAWVTPIPPVYLGGGGSMTFNVSITAPDQGGSCTLSLTISTT